MNKNIRNFDEFVNESGNWNDNTYISDNYSAEFKPDENKLHILTEFEDTGNMSTGPQMSAWGPGYFSEVRDLKDANEIVRRLDKLTDKGLEDGEILNKIAWNTDTTFKRNQDLPY